MDYREKVPVSVSLAAGYQSDIRNVLDFHYNTYRVAGEYAEKMNSKCAFQNQEEQSTYEIASYNAGYNDGLQKIMGIINQLKNYEDTSSGSVLFDAIKQEIESNVQHLHK